MCVQSEEVVTHQAELRKAFSARAAIRHGFPVVDVEEFGANPNDGTFLMNFYDFREFYTHIFAVVDFPKSWCTNQLCGAWEVRLPVAC